MSLATMQSTITASRLPGSKACAQPASFLPGCHSRPHLQKVRRRTVQVQAQQQQQEKPQVAKFADSVGLPTDEGLFGFKPFPEVWVGRLAMMGFLTSIIEEFITKKGTLGQIGFVTPSPPLFITISGAATVATFVALVTTLYKANSGNMSPQDANRYKNFLGINKEGKNIADSQRAMKGQGDPVSRAIGPDNLTDITEARKNIPADQLLNFQDRSDADISAERIKTTEPNQQKPAGPSMSLGARDDEVERQNFANEATLRYARDVEITNGRWAMLGFLAAITIEAATGKGILSQLIYYAKLSGLLGQQSGF